MLMLTRDISEIVMIGNNIQVIVLGVNGSNVALGFKAPRHVPVHREEVYFRNQLFNFNQYKKPHSLYEFNHSKRNEALDNNSDKLTIA